MYIHIKKSFLKSFGKMGDFDGECRRASESAVEAAIMYVYIDIIYLPFDKRNKKAKILHSPTIFMLIAEVWDQPELEKITVWSLQIEIYIYFEEIVSIVWMDEISKMFSEKFYEVLDVI